MTSLLTPLLLLKLGLVPVLMLVITQIGQRWGTVVAGLTVGLPVIGGPVLFFIALEQTPEFARASALASLANIPANLTCGLVFSWLAIRWPWYICGSLAAASFLLMTRVTLLLPHDIGYLSVWTISSLWLAPRLYPRLLPTASAAPAKTRELILRMLAGACVVVTITHFAEVLGPTWAGGLSIFPVLGVTLSLFILVRAGSYWVAEFLRAQALGLQAYYLFTLVLWLLLPYGVAISFTAATAASLTYPALQFLWQRRRYRQ